MSCEYREGEDYHQAGYEKEGQEELTDVCPVLSCDEIRVQYCPRSRAQKLCEEFIRAKIITAKMRLQGVFERGLKWRGMRDSKGFDRRGPG